MRQPSRIVILTGAGISAESGLGTFRGTDGLWTTYDLEEVATPEGFARNPRQAHEFYNARRRNLLNAEPNPAHKALAEFERRFSGHILLVTQNVDDLHERAGSRNLIHMHGELLKSRCENCCAVLAWARDLNVDTPCPRCLSPGYLRPHVVWFGEMPLFMERIYFELGRCDLFVSIGTSGQVYPAADFVREAKAKARARTIELNLEPSDGCELFADRRYGKASEIVPAYFRELLRG
jgi:NAD-dependent deacetylase